MATHPPRHLRLTTATLATVCALALALYPPAREHGSLPLTVPLALAGIATLALALLRRAEATIAVAVALLGAEYATLLHTAKIELSMTPLYAAGLVLVAELAHWSLAEEIGEQPRRRIRRRATAVATAATAGGGLAAMAVLTARSARTAGAWLVPAGAAAVIGVLIIILALARRTSRTLVPHN